MAHEYNKSTGRTYEYDKKYQASSLQKKRRAARNAARRKLESEGLVRKGDGKDVNHKSRSLGHILSSARSNIEVMSRKKNRGKDN